MKQSRPVDRPVKVAPPKPEICVKVELQKIRREMLTLASRVENLVKGQETA